MSQVYVDISKLGPSIDAQMGRGVADAISISIQNSLAVIKDEWQRRIQSTLNSSRPLYLQGLDFNSVVYPFDNDSFAGAVILRGKFPNMLESGFSSFDMKVGFSKSTRKHPSKDGGWYLTIPLRHSTPNSFMYGKPMSKKIYAQAKKLGHMESLRVDGGQTTSWNGYMRKSNIDDSLTRIIKSYRNTNTGKTFNQSQYLTFRRVSDKSDPLSWWHPGFSGVKMAQQLEPYATQIFKAEIEKNLAKILS